VKPNPCGELNHVTSCYFIEFITQLKNNLEIFGEVIEKTKIGEVIG